MAPTRRDLLWLSAAAALLPAAAVAGSANGVPEAIAEFTGGADAPEGEVLLEVPEIADNGGARYRSGSRPRAPGASPSSPMRTRIRGLPSSLSGAWCRPRPRSASGSPKART